jgi:hypothetical protein
MCIVICIADAGRLLFPGVRQIRLPRLISSVQHISARAEVPSKTLCGFACAMRVIAPWVLFFSSRPCASAALLVPAGRRVQDALAILMSMLWSRIAFELLCMAPGKLRGCAGLPVPQSELQ